MEMNSKGNKLHEFAYSCKGGVKSGRAGNIMAFSTAVLINFGSRNIKYLTTQALYKVSHIHRPNALPFGKFFICNVNENHDLHMYGHKEGWKIS